MNSLIRFSNCEINDFFNKSAEWINIDTTVDSTTKFKTSTNYAALFSAGKGLYNISSKSEGTQSYDFGTNNFTIAFWARFKDTFVNINNSIENNRIVLMTESGDKIDYTFIPDTSYHHYAFVRIKNNIRMYIDGVLKSTLATTASFNLDSNSYVFIGNTYKNLLGCDIYVDEIYMKSPMALWNTASFTPPTSYQISEGFYYILYMQQVETYGIDGNAVEYIG